MILKSKHIEKGLLVIALMFIPATLIQAQKLKSKMVNNKYGFFDSNGTEIIKAQYDEVREFSENLAAVRINSSWGYINQKDKVIIPFIYHTALDFINGKAAVRQWNKWGIIDKDNKIINPIEYDAVTRLPYGEYILKQGETKFYFNSYGSYLDKTRIEVIEREIRENEIAKAGVKRDTILGNMVIEKKIDNSGTILSIANKVVNIKFSSFKDIYKSLVYTFDFNGKRNIYFKSGNKAVMSPFTLPTYEQKYFITIPNIPWPGETNPVPEILIKMEDKLAVINVFNNKKNVVPFKLNYNDEIAYNNHIYAVCNFESHSNIVFCSKEISCIECKGEGSIKGKDYYETKTIVTYEIKKEARQRYTTGYDVITRQIPVYKTERVLKKGKSVTCKVCNGSGIKVKSKSIRWNGEKMEE
ncbi:MAG: hypothetical protein FGM46_05595 [Ferruginibacter sp.]|nr:hypothetical protein [Ferruginibacter sp.]